MALETLKDIKKIDGFVVASFPDIDKHKIENNLNFIKIDNDKNSISFILQNGPIKENGVNGCQVDTLIETAKLIIEGLNKKFPCRENTKEITKLDEALLWSMKRKIDRIERNVEGHNLK